jgi:hypothetical protein
MLGFVRLRRQGPAVRPENQNKYLRETEYETRNQKPERDLKATVPKEKIRIRYQGIYVKPCTPSQAYEGKLLPSHQ